MNFIFTAFDLFSQIISDSEISDSDSNLEKFKPIEHESFVNNNTRNDSVSVDKFALPVEDCGAELTEYELERQRNIEERERLFR